VSRNEEVVRSFIAAFNANDLDHIMAFFSEDAVYHNIPIPPVKGTAAIRAVIQGFMGMASEVDWVVHHLAEAPDGTVMTERTDRFRIGDRWVELPVMGAFALRGDRIAEWRDYFDMKQFRDQLPG
jgi:limonene-1,2-epoxide hydrolase